MTASGFPLGTFRSPVMDILSIGLFLSLLAVTSEGSFSATFSAGDLKSHPAGGVAVDHERRMPVLSPQRISAPVVGSARSPVGS